MIAAANRAARWFARLLAGTVLCAAAGTAAAQIDTLKVIIGANPGGGFDQTGRTLGAAVARSDWRNSSIPTRATRRP